MIPMPIWGTLLEKAATDNGFDLEGKREGKWIPFASSQTSLRIWLCVLDGTRCGVTLSRREICQVLTDPGAPWTDPLPPDACAALRLGDVASLHRLIRRAFQLSRALPDAPLQAFLQRTASLPRTTGAERLVFQREGQDLFRNGLIDDWDGVCTVTGLAIPELLRASHITPWAEHRCRTPGPVQRPAACPSDRRRLRPRIHDHRRRRPGHRVEPARSSPEANPGAGQAASGAPTRRQAPGLSGVASGAHLSQDSRSSKSTRRRHICVSERLKRAC